jgi:hypothetical protein
VIEDRGPTASELRRRALLAQHAAGIPNGFFGKSDERLVRPGQYGRCYLCGGPVWSSQSRIESDGGLVVHAECVPEELRP